MYNMYDIYDMYNIVHLHNMKYNVYTQGHVYKIHVFG